MEETFTQSKDDLDYDISEYEFIDEFDTSEEIVGCVFKGCFKVKRIHQVYWNLSQSKRIM